MGVQRVVEKSGEESAVQGLRPGDTESPMSMQYASEADMQAAELTWARQLQQKQAQDEVSYP